MTYDIIGWSYILFRRFFLRYGSHEADGEGQTGSHEADGEGQTADDEDENEEEAPTPTPHRRAPGNPEIRADGQTARPVCRPEIRPEVTRPDVSRFRQESEFL